LAVLTDTAMLKGLIPSAPASRRRGMSAPDFGGGSVLAEEKGKE
jgi:hypothetical protein